MKKVIWILVGVVLIGLALYFVVNQQQRSDESSETFIMPELEVMTLRITSLEEERILLKAQAMIHNKMPLSFQIDSLSYQVKLEGEEIARSTYKDSLSIEASDSSRISLPLTLYQERISNILEQMEVQDVDSIEYHLEARLFTNLPFMEDEPIDLDLSHKVPFVRRVEVNIENASIQKFGLEESEVTVTLQLINPNELTFRASNTGYLFNVDGDSLASGNMDELTSITPRDTTYIEIPIRLKLGEVGESVFNLLFNPGQTEYSFAMNTTLESEVNMLDGSEVNVKNSGKLEDLID